MALKFKLSKEEFEKLSDALKAEYTAVGDDYQLSVDGIDDGKELKEALRKEREERATAKKRVKELEDEQAAKDQAALEKNKEFETLYGNEKKAREDAEKKYGDLKTSVADKDRTAEAMKVVSTLTKDAGKAELLKQQALGSIIATPEGEIKMNGPDGESWDATKLTDHLKTTYPFLVDGSQASGGGAGGGQGGGAAGKKFEDLNGEELKNLRATDPNEYERLKDEYATTQ